MFKRNQEEIDNLNERCAELVRMLKDKEDYLKNSRHNNEVLINENTKIKNENAELRYEIDDMKDRLILIHELITSNQYNNNDALKRKITELSDMTGNPQITHNSQSLM